jgi:hypothetical protein
MSRIQRDWPAIYDALRKSRGPEFQLYDDRMAGFDLFLAVIALDTRALWNLFPSEQAARLYRWVIRCNDSPEYGEYVATELAAYAHAWDDALATRGAREALDAITARLLHRWLGSRIRAFEPEVDGRRTGFIEPLLVMEVSAILAGYIGVWKAIAAECRVVKGDDLPRDG